MKLLRMSLATLALLAVLVAGCTTPWSSESKAAATGRIHAVDGSADIARGPNGNWEAAHIWQTVRTGDRARTGAHGQIDFTLGKYGGVLTLMPDSMIEFEQLGPVTPDAPIVAIINLQEGRVVGDTLKLPRNRRIQIKTRGGVHEIP